MCVCRLSYPTHKVHVLLLYCQLWSVWLYHIFSHSSYRIRFLENLLNVKCVFWFSLQLLFTTLPTVRRTELNTVTNVHMSSHKVSIIILVRLEWNSNFLIQFLKIYSNMNFHERLSSGSQFVPCRQTDMMTLIVAFHNFVNTPKNYIWSS